MSLANCCDIECSRWMPRPWKHEFGSMRRALRSDCPETKRENSIEVHLARRISTSWARSVGVREEVALRQPACRYRHDELQKG
jgi:hypothetical protein